MSAPDEPAAVFLADPPWEHDDALGSRGARAKYTTMPTADICALKLPPRAERCALVLWRLANMPQDALDVARAWGFLPLAEVVWTKLRPCTMCCATGRVDAFRFPGTDNVLVPGTDNVCPLCRGRRGEELIDDELGALPTWLGLGTTVRNVHETALICRPIDGRAPERLDAGVRSSFAAPMLADIDGLLDMRDAKDRLRKGPGALVHSAKPDAIYSLIERLYPGPRVEMFGRQPRAGWSMAYSDQDDRLVEVARIFRDVWPARTREQRLDAARSKARR